MILATLVAAGHNTVDLMALVDILPISSWRFSPSVAMTMNARVVTLVMFKLIILFLVWNQERISQDVLDAADMSRPAFAVAKGNKIYLSRLSRIVMFDSQKRMTGYYDRKGEGPGEFNGGPIFWFRDQVWAYDLRGKIIKFSQNLNYLREVRLVGSHAGSTAIVAEYDKLFTARVEKVMIYLEQWQPDSFELQKTVTREWNFPGSRMTGPKLAALGSGFLALYQTFQFQERYKIVLWSVRDRVFFELGHLLPEWEKRHEQIRKLTDAAFAITGVTGDDRFIYVFIQSGLDEARQSKGKVKEQGHIHCYDRVTFRPVSIEQTDGNYVRSHYGPSDRVFLYFDDTGIETLDSGFPKK